MTARLEPVAAPLSEPVAAAVDATDWTEHAVLDVVTFAPATGLGFEGDRQRVEVYRYRGRAPPVGTYGTDERACRVQRVTEPLVRQLERRP